MDTGKGWTFQQYLKNHLGSTMMVYQDATEVYRSDYGPYGKPREEVEAVGTKLTKKFTDKELDTGLDLTYFGARYYDQDFGVWTSVDPRRQYVSGYTYCGNNPVNCADPDGRGRAHVSSWRPEYDIPRLVPKWCREASSKPSADDNQCGEAN